MCLGISSYVLQGFTDFEPQSLHFVCAGWGMSKLLVSVMLIIRLDVCSIDLV